MISKNILAVWAACCLANVPATAQDPPRLVVFIAVDQMRADYLSRFETRFEGGFVRLRENGLQFTNMNHAHAMTETAPGHATLVSGVHPSRAGIPANEWWDRSGLRRSYAAEDASALILEAPLSPGRSPTLLLRSTLGDWFKSTSVDAKVFSIAIKDRVGVLLGGKQPNEAYWYDMQSGRYVTSTYYAREYPDWLNAFNEGIGTPEQVGRTWERLLPEESYGASRADSFPAENGGSNFVFPHIVDVLDTVRSPFLELVHTPFADQMTLSLARELIAQEEIGEDEVTDILFIGLSAGDYIGHRYGPYSQETEDYYLRLDGMLGEFFEYLDERLGRNQYMTVVTADHGVVRVPEYSNSLGDPGRRLTTDDFREELIEGLTTAVNELEIYAQPTPMIMYPLGLVLRFEGEEIPEEKLRRVRAIVADHLRESDVIADVFTYDELLSPSVHRGDIEMYRKSFHPDRAADLTIQYQQHDTFPPSLTANHGSPYGYDTHVPFIVMAAGLNPGVIDRPVWTVDIAPSLAAMLGVTAPDDLDGDALPELVRWRMGR